MLNQPSTNQPVSSTSEHKAAIVDHLSLTCPNQTFIETATNMLKQAGYTVDYYPGEEITVEFYRNLPTHRYGLVILRVHSAATRLSESAEYVEAPVSFFTSENYSVNKYAWEQLTEQLLMASYSMPQPPYYFAITPEFVTSCTNGKFQNTIIIMMGCEGLSNTKMAEALVAKGAKIYIGWNASVSASHTDTETIRLLQHLLTEGQTLSEAVAETLPEVVPDQAYKSKLGFYPFEARNYTIKA